MPKENKMPKEYAITISLAIFFAIVTLVGVFRLFILTKEDKYNIDLNNIAVLEQNTNIDLSSYNLAIKDAITTTYDIDIYYGERYNVESVNAIPLTNSKDIYTMLIRISEALSNYPKDLIREIEKRGYSVSVYLVDSFKTNVQALANRNTIGQFKIYISNSYDLDRAYHHEFYHILDYYIKLETNETLAYIDWYKYNPVGFEYIGNVENITAKYTYMGSTGAYFVTPYAKFSEKEDRAETFAEMVAAKKEEVFFRIGEPIRGKIDIIKEVLRSTFNTVDNSYNLVWE